MNKKVLLDFNYEYSKLSNLVRLLGKDIYYLEYPNIYLFKIVNIKLEEITKDDIKVTFECSPKVVGYFNSYNYDIELKLEDLHEKWFLTETSCRDYRTKESIRRSGSLF